MLLLQDFLLAILQKLLSWFIIAASKRLRDTCFWVPFAYKPVANKKVFLVV